MAVRTLKLGLYLLCLMFLSSWASTVVSDFEFKHHNNQDLKDEFWKVHRKCPNITRIYALSETSVQGHPIYVLVISDYPEQHELLEPEFRYVANMHGNEVSGRETLLKLAHELCDLYLKKDDVTTLVDTTKIYLIPTMNPDGWDVAWSTNGLEGRTNNNSVDLNRDFPDLDRIIYSNEREHVNKNNHVMEELQYFSVQPETLAMMKLIMKYPFVLAANFHNGALVANYPYDSSRSGAMQEYAKSPDDEVFKSLARSYSTLHPYMGNAEFPGCDKNEDFSQKGGITNGAKWYSVRGGMQDFSYLSSNALEITLEIGCAKFPDAKTLEQEWLDNRDSIINFIWQVHTGIKGLVTDAKTRSPIPGATVHVRNVTQGKNEDINHDVTTVHSGDYWRLLTPGTYEVTVWSQGYLPSSKFVDVKNPGGMEAQRVDFTLLRPQRSIDEQYARRRKANWNVYSMLRKEDPLRFY